MDNKKIEFFDNEQMLLDRVQELELKGVKESDMYVVVNDKENVSFLRKDTSVKVEEVEDDALQRENHGPMANFAEVITGETLMNEAFTKMDIDQSEREKITGEIQKGKCLLYVDSDYGRYYDEFVANYQKGFSNVNEEPKE